MPGPKVDEQLLIRIQQAFEEQPYASIREIADNLHESISTVWRYVTQRLGRVFKASRWVPHLLTEEQKLKRVHDSQALYEVLIQCQSRQFRNILTGDQSWFSFTYGMKGAWVMPEDDNPEFDGSKISSNKIMVTVIWGVNGIYLVDFLEEGYHFNSTYFIEHILLPLHEMSCDIWTESSKRKIWLHLDNCKVHNSKAAMKKYDELGFKRTPHPPYSPDLAPSDFFLFGYTKDKLKGRTFKSREALEEEISDIFENISREKKIEVFESWINRCMWVAEHNGVYYKAD